MSEISKAYNSKEVEDEIYKKWEESGKFNPDNLELPEDAEKFSISMPPPNATGVLHLGHASMLAYQDLMIRYNRMKGRKTLWLPGTDHASIATQTKVEKIIAKEGKTKYDLGRKKFLERVNKYVENSKNTIKNQTRKMGSSCDWSRERYTLDDGLSRAVREVFVKMYNDELIYRGDRIVNWCPRCESTLADDEVEHKDQKANLYYFKYDKDFPITIATTRPETKLGDTAVAVNPKDERYKKYIGKVYKIDLGNGEHNIRIIADREVDMEFGTGALGVTPAHSMTDWEMAEKNDLEKIKIIGEDGKMNDNAGKDYAGLTVLEAREKFVKYLEDNNLIEKFEEVDQSLSVCYRCRTSIEPLPSKQWFVDVDKKITIEGNKYFQNKSLKEVSLEVVKNKETEIIPERFEKTYFHWMKNLRDWCISRQIWFGHRIPVWYKNESGIRNQESGINITYFVHGTTVDNEKNKASGHYNVELSKLGIQQSKDLKKTIKDQKFDIVFCSDLKRAVDFASLAFAGRNIKIIQDKRLRECDYGNLTQSDASEILAIEKNVINKPFSNGESYKDVEKKISEFLSDLIDNYQGKKIAIVAHKAPQLALDVIIKNKTWEQAIDEDWRKIKAWKPGWKYELTKEAITTNSTIIQSMGLKSKTQEIYVGTEPPEGEGWTQDQDTLDTWFSSGLWTFSTLLDQDHEKYKTFEDWIANSPDLKKFHPTSVMETGYDILFFWVARMILMTTYAIGEIPFEKVYLHGMVCDKQGRKMSKSLGNGIDPIEMIEKYGTDALRLSMIIGSSPGNDIKMYEEKIEGYRNFVNKLWNISRYILMTVDKKSLKLNSNIELGTIKKSFSLFDFWILLKTQNIINKVSEKIDNYEFSAACEMLKEFTWNEFADWYIEISKIEREKYEKDGILVYVLENLLKSWHPFAPFVTEKIWSEFKKEELLMVERWNKAEILRIPGDVISEAELIIEIIKSIRSIRAEYGVKPNKKIKVIIYAGNKEELVESEIETIKKMRTGISKLEIKKSGEKIDQAVYTSAGSVEIYLLDLIDKGKEGKRLQKEIDELEKYIQQIRIKLGNDNFVANAPREIVEKEREKYQGSSAKLEKLKKKLVSLGS